MNGEKYLEQIATSLDHIDGQFTQAVIQLTRIADQGEPITGVAKAIEFREIPDVRVAELVGAVKEFFTSEAISANFLKGMSQNATSEINIRNLKRLHSAFNSAPDVAGLVDSLKEAIFNVKKHGTTNLSDPVRRWLSVAESRLAAHKPEVE